MLLDGGVARKSRMRRLKPVLLATCCEERLDDGGTFGGEDARSNFHLMIKARVGEDFEAGADGAAFRIVGTVDQAGHAGLEDCARAHAAGLDGDVERSISKAVVAKKASGFAQSHDFGVGGRITIADGPVARTGNNLALVDKHGSDRNFAGCGRGTGFRQGLLHVLDVSFHAGRENNMRKERKRN
jgi:hypothetical protein